MNVAFFILLVLDVAMTFNCEEIITCDRCVTRFVFMRFALLFVSGLLTSTRSQQTALIALGVCRASAAIRRQRSICIVRLRNATVVATHTIGVTCALTAPDAVGVLALVVGRELLTATRTTFVTQHTGFTAGLVQINATQLNF